ncbi:hypothetical protein BM613_14260, partial [Sulfoacidibacillus thermotolerans]
GDGFGRRLVGWEWWIRDSRCMGSRGLKQVCGSSTITKAFRGATELEHGSDIGKEWRREFLEACKK